MNIDSSQFAFKWRPDIRRMVTAIGVLAVIAVVVLYAWNSLAVPVLDAETLRFREALGLTLLVAIAGRLLASRGHGDARRER